MATTTTRPLPEVAARLRALREALGLTQEQVAERTGGTLARTYVVRIETGKNLAKTDHVRGALADVYGLSRDDMAAYLDARCDLDEVLRRRARRAAAPPAGGPPTLRSHPRWPELVAEAQRLRGLPAAAFERLADSPWVWGPLESVDAVVLADLARDVHEWAERAGRR